VTCHRFGKQCESANKLAHSKVAPETVRIYSSFYFTSTALVVLPPTLLRTVMFCGLVETLNSPRYCPAPLFPSVPMSAPEAVLKTCNVALEFVLVASTRKIRLPESNSARVILTVSVAGGGVVPAGLIVSDALRVNPLNVPLIVAVVVAVTAVVLTVNVAEDAPAATVTDGGTVADALLLASVTNVADVAAALNLTVP
jgi:hypothetical protein